LFKELCVEIKMSRNNPSAMQRSEQKHPDSLPVEETEVRTTSTRIRVLHVLILGGFGALGALATDMYVTALPSLSHDLSASTSQAQMTLSAFILGLALGQVIVGPISDALGRRRPLLIGVAGYALAALLCSITPSIITLILLRFVQGFAGSVGIAIALAIASDLYVGSARVRFFSLLMQINGITPMIAPVLGGQVLRFTSWHGIFVTLALYGIILFVATAFGLGETLEVSRRRRGGISATFFDFRELLTDRRFIGYALSCGFAFTACIVYISISPFILQGIYGVSPQLLGILYGINGLGIVIAAQINSRLVDRFLPQTLLTWGYTVLVLGGMGVLVATLTGIGLVGILPSFFLLVSSLGLIMPNATTLALANTRAAGSASALLGVLQLVIGAIVAPLIGLGGNTTALPMALAIAAFGLASLGTFLVFCRPAQVDAMA
jgi:MFS transporter, DHA1 family, multidrug resistance protein